MALEILTNTPTRRTAGRINMVLDGLSCGVSFWGTADGGLFRVEPDGDWKAASIALRSAGLLGDRDDTLIRWCSGSWIDSKTDEFRRCRRQARDGEELCAHCLDDARSEDQLHQRILRKREASVPDTPPVPIFSEPEKKLCDIWPDPCEPLAPDGIRDDAAVDAIEAERRERFPGAAKIERIAAEARQRFEERRLAGDLP